MKKIELLYKTGRTLFTIDELRMLWEETNEKSFPAKIQYLVRTERLTPVHRGIYSLSKHYDPFDLATKLVNPSYISLDSALQHHGVIFQTSKTIHSIAYYFKSIKIAGTPYHYHQMKKDGVINPIGVYKEKNYWIASPERAIGDWIYLRGLTDFDNLNKINKELLRQVATIYEQKRTQKDIETFIQLL